MIIIREGKIVEVLTAADCKAFLDDQKFLKLQNEVAK
jgi:hypothetical protein